MVNIMHLAHRRGNWVLVSDDEVLDARGLQVIEWGHDWSIEKQQQYAKRYGMCPRVCDVLDSKRICGKHIKNGGKNRKVCSRCTIRYPAPTGRVVDRTKMSQSEGCQASWDDIRFSGSCGSVSPSRPATRSVDSGCQTEENTTSMANICNERWEQTYAPQHRANMKSGLKKYLEMMSLDMTCSTEQFIETFDDWEEAASKIHTSKGSHNKFTAVRGILRQLRCYDIAKNLTLFQQSKAKPKEHDQRISPERVQCINVIAKTLDVDMCGERPGQALLGAIQDAVFRYMPKNELQRKFMFRQLLGFWVPAARNKSSDLTVHKGYIQDFEKTIRNHVILNRGGEVKGLFFGNLKMTTTKRFKHCWVKRIQISASGIQMHNTKPIIPSHIEDDEWAMWWKILATVLDEQLTSRRHGASVFPAAPTTEIETDFFGCRMGSMLTRMIFRNGYPKVTREFVEVVMSHCEAVDQRSYVKPRLMNGPWSAVIVPDNNGSPPKSEE